jgi:tetratricopeptide (TPR) repeat protein
MNDQLEQGIKLLRQVENKKAINVFKNIIKVDSDNPEVYRHLGLAHFNIGEYSEALENWNRCLDLDPTHHQTWWNLGQLYDLMNDPKNAHFAYSKAEIMASTQPAKAARYHEWVKKTKSKLDG